MTSLKDAIAATRERLAAHGQEHLLRFVGELDESRARAVLAQCDGLPLDLLAREMPTILGTAQADSTHARIEPVDVIPAHPEGWIEFAAAGEALLRAGKVACFTVAGGQGTRLGWDAPKGTFPASPVTERSLFQIFAEGILGLRKRYGAALDWIVMTSPQNDAPTREFFGAHGSWGLAPGTVRFIVQGTMPALDRRGKILLSDRGELATNPDGHGGSIRALAESGELARLRKQGVEHLSYFQVDNPLVHPAEPLFLGLHATHPSSGGQMSSRSVARRSASEKVGVFCQRAGRVGIIEYSDMPPELAAAVLDDGRLLHSAGNIAVHALSIGFIERLTHGGFALPFHVARKRVPCLDADGVLQVPAEPNGLKLETFIFDALPLADRPIVVDSCRDDWYAPIKNADGGDSPTTSKAAQVARAARWLGACGVSVPRDQDGAVDAVIEIDPALALSVDDLRAAFASGRADAPQSLGQGSRTLLSGH
ncbi:MAG: UTP--glucose-1-phosphate uridylyltransferase [Planctomycetota bacterium]|nr:UTP--glucose-1-phosphate uridylyltransferase [Planctomycetota bacterium]MDA1105617.1 UTP--glucose-1-phosphate uridylyltransferase [Planctomycetota bacterium]